MSDDAATHFQALGRGLEDAWRRASYDERAFPALAVAHLEDAALPNTVTMDSILDWALTTRELPTQQDPDAKFGQPPLTMFVGRCFHISVLFWVDGTTAIHQHGFCGAFQVLAGSSIHTRYTFEERRRVSSRLQFGQLTARGSELLRAGSSHPIESKSDFIHALFHLERPSVSIVVRTFGDPEAQPQLCYLPPGIAYDPFVEDAWQRRIAQLVELLVSVNDPGCERRLTSLLREEDLFTCFRALRAARRLTDQRILSRLLDVLGERDREAADSFAAALAESRRTDGISKRRSGVVDPELRFFLAALLNGSDRSAVLDLIGTHNPGHDSVEGVVTFLGRIGQVGVPLEVHGESWDANIFGLPQAPVGWEDALRAELRGAPRLPATAEVIAYIERMKHTPTLATLFRLPV